MEWLEYFSDAARLGSIKASANKHNISPQGLSKCIRSLETELGVKLFERDANSVRLTSEGARLLDQVRTTIDAARKLTKMAQDMTAGNAKAPLAVMCSSFVFLCGMMAPLREGIEAIDRTASYSQLSTAEIFATLSGKAGSFYEGRALCGVPILFSPLKEQNEAALLKASLNGYDYAPLLAYRDGALVSSNHPLASHECIGRADLLEYPVVSSSSEQFNALSKYVGAEHISSAIADLATRLQVIRDGASVMLTPPFLDAASDPDYRFVTIEDAYEVEIGFVYDRSELDERDIEQLASPILAAFAPFEEAGFCSFAPGQFA
ncbi:MAG: LysR family transcriptional regulator [Eggerthellaceae bacterium]|nr:LysR family transcriptional regulator [Eggerthellaceae bacterium]